VELSIKVSINKVLILHDHIHFTVDFFQDQLTILFNLLNRIPHITGFLGVGFRPKDTSNLILSNINNLHALESPIIFEKTISYKVQHF